MPADKCRSLGVDTGSDAFRTQTGVDPPERDGICVEADETFQCDGRKGSREWVRHERDPRRNPAPPRPRWRDFRRLGLPLTTGLSRWQIPILTLTDRAGAHRADRLPDRHARSLVAVLQDRVRQDAVLCSDGDDAYRLFTHARGMPHYRLSAKRGPKVIHGAFHIQTVNSLHSRFKAFMKPFCGPATKNLPAYIVWFIARLDGTENAQNNAWSRMLAA